LMPARSATRAVVKRRAPSRLRTCTAASRMSATRRDERACCGSLRDERRGVFGLFMGFPEREWQMRRTIRIFFAMTTLIDAPLAPLLDRLFAEADASTNRLRQEMAQISAAERQRMMTTTTEYRAFYERAKDFPLAVSRETGRLLYLLARSSGARSIVEFGT